MDQMDTKPVSCKYVCESIRHKFGFIKTVKETLT